MKTTSRNSKSARSKSSLVIHGKGWTAHKKFALEHYQGSALLGHVETTCNIKRSELLVVGGGSKKADRSIYLITAGDSGSALVTGREFDNKSNTLAITDKLSLVFTDKNTVVYAGTYAGAVAYVQKNGDKALARRDGCVAIGAGSGKRRLETNGKALWRSEAGAGSGLAKEYHANGARLLQDVKTTTRQKRK